MLWLLWRCGCLGFTSSNWRKREKHTWALLLDDKLVECTSPVFECCGIAACVWSFVSICSLNSEQKLIGVCKVGIYHCLVLDLEENLLWSFYSWRCSDNGWLQCIYSFWFHSPWEMEELNPELLYYLEMVCTVIGKVVVSLTRVCDQMRLVALPWLICSLSSHRKHTVLPCPSLSAENSRLAVCLLFTVLLKSRCNISFISLFWVR